MNVKEYNEQLNSYLEQIRKVNSEAKELKEAMFRYQYENMTDVLDDLRKRSDTPAMKVICDILDYAINFSTSGSSIQYVDTKELADEVNEIIWDELGDFMLDAPQIYQSLSDGKWAISCMFGGNYIPEWDGFDI